MRRSKGSIVSAIALGTCLLVGMLPAQALAVIPEGFFETHHVETIEMEGEHSAAITSDGSLWVWGASEAGQLGDGTTQDRLTPIKVMDNVVDVELGELHYTAITEDGSLYAWGINQLGQVGDGTLETRDEPVKIMDNVIDVAPSFGSTLALTEDGAV